MTSTSAPLLSKETQGTPPAEKWFFQGGDDGDLEDGRRRTCERKVCLKTEGNASSAAFKIPDEDKKLQKLQLYRAALIGQWGTEEQTGRFDQVINDKITKGGNTALHVAALAGHSQFVRQLIQKMNPDAVRMDNDAGKEGNDAGKKGNQRGNTAFCYAAISGDVEVAQAMLERSENLDLVNIIGRQNRLPLHLAAVFGHGKMASYLYPRTDYEKMKHKEAIDLLVTLIDNEIYDVAIQMVKDHPELAADQRCNGRTAIHALARKNFDHQTLPIAWKNDVNLGYRKEVQKKNAMHQDYPELLHLLWGELLRYNDSKILEVIRNVSKTSQACGNDSKASQASESDSNTSQRDGKDSQISKVIKSYNHSIFKAAAQGNVEFLITLIGSYPDLLFELDENKHSIFHIAVLHRQEKVFALIKTIGSTKHFIAVYKEKETKNSMLHLAGKLSPQRRLDVIPGAAFQLQHELLWFEEVKKVVRPKYIEYENKDGEKPRDVFLKEHEKLIDEGKTWMQETASQCILVATFIAGVAFAAALSVPGGTDSGVPVLLKQTSFQVFAVTDGLSLVFSICAMLNFFAILISRRKLEDYLQRLPNKLVLGQGALFFSIVALMVAFVAAFFIVFRHGKLGLFVPIAALAPIPVLLFIFQRHDLIVDIIRSTCVSKSMFQPDKYSLMSAWKSNGKSIKVAG